MPLIVGYFNQFSWFRRLNSTQTHQWCLPMLKSLKLDYSCNYISRTFLHHHANVVSYRTNSSFKHGHFLITSCFERNLATLYLTDCSNKAKEITLQTYPYLAGQRRWCRPLKHIYWNVKCSKNEAVKLPLAIELLHPEALPFLVSAHGRSYFLYEHMLPFRWQIAVM